MTSRFGETVVDGASFRDDARAAWSGYAEREDPLTLVLSAMETIDSGTAATRGDDVEWCRSWRNTLWRYGKDKLWAIDKACRRVIGSKADESEKETARKCLHFLRDGYRLALRVEEVEHDLKNIYPTDKARWRLDNELGWEHRPTDDMKTKLDRICMLIRADNPDTDAVGRRAYAYIRSQFPNLEFRG